MSALVLGGDWVSITVGVRREDENGEADMPYFGIAPAENVLDDIDIDDQKKVREAFEKHGTLFYFDNMHVADTFVQALLQTLTVAAEKTDWAQRMPNRVVVQ